MYYRYVNASSQQYCMYWFLKYPFVEGDLRAQGKWELFFWKVIDQQVKSYDKLARLL